ncbi:carbon monoxide dehydrogenase [Azospirillum sp. TSA2s]|uniref:CoxG family protein n=1 Tax=Azospirillum sp. TSA2s TaxID=709810 RepID=UPI0010AAD3BB|nr:carbon monoxide dehydrogenase subunit G [Azospirillum sp. TSA2s]QCG93282.1 carbon monoxide dehydrogenase [Azospirillum sp. TSA2s]
MELTGEQRIAAPRLRVWESLNDPQVLKHCIPGCEEVIRHSDTAFEARVLTKVGPLRARFSGQVEMCDIDAPAGCTLRFEGGAGSVGMARGQSRVTLEEAPDGTLLRYTAEAAIGGKLSQIGGRLIDASARKMADDFFRAFNDRLTGPADAAADGTPAAPADIQSQSQNQPLPQPGLPADAPRRPAAPAAAPVHTGGWGGEFQRFFWLATGAVLGGVIGYLIHI